jgi:hypothetical protein
MVASGMRFNDCLFSEPVRLAGWTPPRCPGLYAILIVDSNWAPKPFQPLYFGEFGNNVSPSVLQGQYGSILPAVKGQELFVVVLPMPFSTLQLRWALRSQLAWAYNPIYQTDSAKNHSGEWESNYHSPAGERFFEPPPERRRRIGFLPLADPPSGEPRY